MPAFMVRQNAMTNEEWIMTIETLADAIRPHMNNLTLKSLVDVRIIFDDYGRHSLEKYRMGTYNICYDPGCTVMVRAIYPPEDDRISVNDFRYSDDDIEPKMPISQVQRLWGFSKTGQWLRIEVRSDITNEVVPPHINRRCTPKFVSIMCAELNDAFWKFTSLTPKKFYYLFAASIKILLDKRREILSEVLELDTFMRQIEFRLAEFPDSASKFGE